MNIEPSAQQYALILSVSNMLSSDGVESFIRKSLENEQIEGPVTHHFGPGIYIREAAFRAGSFVVGRIHKQAHTNYMHKGRLIMFREDGSFEEMSAPMMFTASPGRKMAYIIEDVVWQNIYATDETDIDKIESMFFGDEDILSDHLSKVKELETLKCDPYRDDYESFLCEFGLTEKIVRDLSENETDQIGMPNNYRTFRVSDSPIQGKGFFSTAPIKSGEIIAPANIGGFRTTAGRYTNHSPDPNAEFIVEDNGDVFLVAIKDIRGCVGGNIGEEVTINYRSALNLRFKNMNIGEELCRHHSLLAR